MKTQRLCYACDLKDDEQLIDKYIEYHAQVWPEIKKSISDAGILDMQIYQVSNRLFMIIEVDASFDEAKKAKMDRENAIVQKWEILMDQFQKPIPSPSGVKWVPMKRIFKLTS